MKYFTLVFYVFVGITSCLIIISGIVYLVNNFGVFKEEKKDNTINTNEKSEQSKSNKDLSTNQKAIKSSSKKSNKKNSNN